MLYSNQSFAKFLSNFSVRRKINFIGLENCFVDECLQQVVDVVNGQPVLLEQRRGQPERAHEIERQLPQPTVEVEDHARAGAGHLLQLAEDDLDFAGVDGIFHLAGQPGVRSFGPVFADYVRRNVLASQRVFEAATAAAARVVFASSSSVYGDAETYPTPEDTPPLPLSPYGITKLSSEHLARAYAQSFGLDVVVLRYFTVYGPRQRPDMALARIVEALAAGTPFELYGDGSQSRSFTYVADTVDATITRVMPYGAFARIGHGIEGLIHVSEIADHRIASPDEIVHVGDAVRVRVVSVDAERRRISLSMRQAEPV